MANGDSNEWFPNFDTHMDIQDASEVAQDSDNAYEHPAFAGATRMAQVANEAFLRLQAQMHAIQTSSIASNLTQNSNQGLNKSGYAFSYQQGNQAQMAPLGQWGPQVQQALQTRRLEQSQQPQQSHWSQQTSRHPTSQGIQRQQRQSSHGQQPRPYPLGQHDMRQPGNHQYPTFYPSNTSRRAQNQPPKTFRLVSDQGTAVPVKPRVPTSNQVPGSLNGVTHAAYSPSEGLSQTAPLPFESTAMPIVASKSSSGSLNIPASVRSLQSRPAPTMFNPTKSVLKNRGPGEQPSTFVPHSGLAVPPQGNHGRPINSRTEDFTPQSQTTREVQTNGLPSVTTPSDTSDSLEPRGEDPSSSTSMVPPSSIYSGIEIASNSQAQTFAPGANVNDTRAPAAKRRKFEDDNRRAVNSPSGRQPDLSHYVHRPMPRSHITMRSDLVEPIDARDAALKESYDPTTIARDVLINADKHPSEPNLNHHLEILQKLSCVNTNSDLATLRWDLLDPDSPRDVTPHRSPASRPPNALGVLPFAPPSYYSRPSLPPSAAPVFLSTRPTYNPPPRSLPPPSSTPRPLLPAPPPVFTRPPPEPTPTPTLVQQPVVELEPSSEKTPAPTPTSVAPTQPATPSSFSSRRASESSKLKAPSQSPLKSPRAQVQVVIPASPHRMPPRKRVQVNRTKKSDPRNNVEVAIHHEPTVPYAVFRCQWSECSAELHNLQALQSHVLKVHIPHNLRCNWGDCADQIPRAAADMWEHVITQHIAKVGWVSGDGPVIPSSADTLPGSSGFQFSLRNPRPESMTLPANENTIDTFSRVHGAYNPKQKAEKFRDGGYRWKEGTGVDTDASDRSLSRPAMQPFVPDVEIATTINNP